MAVLAISFISSFVFYLVLSAGSGEILLWSGPELFFGAAFAGIVSVFAEKTFKSLGIRASSIFLHPKRWLLLFIYAIGPLLFHMAKANLDVAYRVITGKIRPGIVKVPTGLKKSLAVTLLANSITLTPGTLSVDIDKENNLYVHWIYVRNKKPKPEEVCGSFIKWARRIAE